MSKILIVEDEAEIATHIIRFFNAKGFETQHLASGEHVCEHVKVFKPDLIILDLMIPHTDGLTVCEQVRNFSNVPIIMVTAKVSEMDRLKGLESGADDYVCKPFSAAELVMRAQAILRRTQNNVNYEVLTIDSNSQKLVYKDTVIPLTALEFDLVELLFNNPERVYSRDQIIERAYPGLTEITDRTIDSHIKNIRKKFKQANMADKVIESVYGAGYRLVLPK